MLHSAHSVYLRKTYQTNKTIVTNGSEELIQQPLATEACTQTEGMHVPVISLYDSDNYD